MKVEQTPQIDIRHQHVSPLTWTQDYICHRQTPSHLQCHQKRDHHQNQNQPLTCIYPPQLFNITFRKLSSSLWLSMVMVEYLPRLGRNYLDFQANNDQHLKLETHVEIPNLLLTLLANTPQILKISSQHQHKTLYQL